MDLDTIFKIKSEKMWANLSDEEKQFMNMDNDKSVLKRFNDIYRKAFIKPQHENYFVSPYEIDNKEIDESVESWNKLADGLRAFGVSYEEFIKKCNDNVNN